ncbi:MAG: MATE family efflux transporter [Spirochaetaceae bacterium]|jgi:putative MATE family efflux protein|nr:MATE family efflux transporter [Spirochaetaceae bacterium]
MDGNMNYRGGYYKTILRLALPIGLQNLVGFTVNFADNIMVGRLGDLSIAGVFIGNQIHSMVMFITGGIGAALVILSTQYWGKKDVKSIRSLTGIALRVALGVGALFTFVTAAFPGFIAGLLSDKDDVIQVSVPYLRLIGFSFVFFTLSQVLVASQRSVEKVRFGMNIALLTLTVNVGLNYCLIFGKLGFPALGITGAGLATLISRILECLIAGSYVFGIDRRIALRFSDLGKPDRFLVFSLFKYGAPVVAGDIVWAANSFAYTAIVGRFTADIIASFNIAGMMNTLVYIWISGLAEALGIMTGKLVGSGAPVAEIKSHAFRTQRFFPLVGLATGLFVFFAKGGLISFYNISPEAARTARQLLSVLALTMVGTTYQMPGLGGLVKAGGNISFVFRNDFIFVFLVVIPSSVIAMVLKAPAWVVFLCLKCDQILKCFVAVVVINRFRWIRDLTRGR